MSFSQVFGDLPLVAVVALILLGVTQLSLQIFGLIDLVRREEVPGGRKWLWALVIVLGSVIGALVYLAVGRSAARMPAGDGEARGGGESATRRAVDKVYGPDDRA